MSDNGSNIPSWVQTAIRVDRPDVDTWYKPEQHGPLEGTLIWRGQQHARSGNVYNAYAVRTESGTVFAVAESAGLRDLRQVSVGSAVFIQPTTVKTLANGRTMLQFRIFAKRIEPMSQPPRMSERRENVASDGAAKDGDAAPEGAATSEEVPF
jgi:hypothetical protein